jgi:endonuclease/exonuclease/phosphatase family metal-dependent hydrolase
MARSQPSKGDTMPRKAKAKIKKDRISSSAEWLAAQPLLTELTLTALTVLFGMQVLRVLVPGMFWILSDRMKWSTIELGAIALAIAVTGFLAGPLSRLSGNRRLVVITAGGLGLIRLFMQVWWAEPLFNLSLAVIGTMLFTIFLPACLETARLQGGSGISRFALGLLGGLALDTAINGAFSTYDTVWQVEPLPVLLTLILVIIQLALLAGITFTRDTKLAAPRGATGISVPRSLTWLTIGPFLFLELVIFQNIPRTATLTGWTLPLAFGLTVLAQLAGLATATWLLSKAWRTLWLWALGAGIALIPALVFGYYQGSAALTALPLFVGQVLISAFIIMVLIGIATSTGKTQRFGLSIANGIGTLIMLIFIFAYYAVYDMSLPYANVHLEPIAGFIMAICALSATVILPQATKATLKLWAVPLLALLLLVLPLAMSIAWREPTATSGKGFPVRIMTYNLHNGFNTKGKLNIEEIAQVIENSSPDIIALQEVSRGWVVSGRLDMLAWLSQRLNMPYVFAPTADPLWGNAILSRYLILAYSRQDLPPRDLLILRGFIVALIDLGNDDKLKVIATHFHHPEGGTEIRQLQARTILDFTDNIGGGHIVLLGDLNAEPSGPEMTMIRQARLVDVGERMNPHMAYTFASHNPYKRIDYICISPDLQIGDIQVPLSTASDHLPVVADIDK